MVVPEETKEKWDKFVKNSEINTLSKLIRLSVESYIKSNVNHEGSEGFADYTHDLKGELSSIKGFSQILISEYKDELSWDVLLKIKEIYDRSVNIEKIMNKILKDEKVVEIENYDVLIVDDNESTIFLLSDFFKKKGFLTKTASTVVEALNILNRSSKNVPKLILLDVLLPDDKGYELCKKIKSDKRLKNVLVYYITAVPEIEIVPKIKETKADGYFLKPFNMMEFNEELIEKKLRGQQKKIDASDT